MKKENIFKYILLAFVLLYSSILSGCAGKNQEEEADEYTIYYINADETGLYSTNVFIEYDSPEMIANRLIDELRIPSDKLLYKNAIGNQFELLSMDIVEDQVVLNFSKEYLNQPVVTEVLNRAAIVRTLGQTDGINGVSFVVNGAPITDSDGNLIGNMKPDDFIINAGKEINAYEQTDLVLYFSNDDGSLLEMVKRNVVYNSNIPLERLVIDELLKGPLENEAGFITLSPEVKIISTTVTDRVCYVSFDQSFMNQQTSVLPEVVIYSIVNSLIELPNINRVQISIDGDTSLMYKEVMPLNNLYERNLELVD